MSRLDDALNRLAAEHAEAEAPALMESALRSEFDRALRGRRAGRWIGSAAAVAASVAIAVLAWEHRPAHEAVVSKSAEAPSQAQPAESDQPFVPIPYVLPPAPYERVEVVRMQLPVAALIAAGFRMETADQGAQAEADVMVGQDGRARAIRVISISSVN